jgi:hypothetical protein
MYALVGDPPPTIHECAPTFIGDDGVVGLWIYECYFPIACGGSCFAQYPDFQTLPEPPIATPVTGKCCNSVCQDPVIQGGQCCPPGAPGGPCDPPCGNCGVCVCGDCFELCTGEGEVCCDGVCQSAEIPCP